MELALEPEDSRTAEITVQDATAEDIAGIVEIFNHEVREGSSNYESIPQTVEERAKWVRDLQMQNYPVLVAKAHGRVVGFGALTPFARFSGYKHTTSGCLYVHHEFRTRGVGRYLGCALWAQGAKRGFHSVIAGVNSKNKASLSLLKSMGFQERGYFPQIGFKNGEWLDDVCLQLFFRNKKQGDKNEN
jgi:phosphinothricin acetyltransferase